MLCQGKEKRPHLCSREMFPVPLSIVKGSLIGVRSSQPSEKPGPLEDSGTPGSLSVGELQHGGTSQGQSGPVWLEPRGRSTLPGSWCPRGICTLCG